ncbi:MAG: TylF/MycF family methyltransferase [Acidobacteriota bacterium]|nr:TylF/MycF family methyltransferase [Acidobacteriota bacterium]
MLPLAGHFERVARACLRRLPLSDYQKTRLWATSISQPQGPVRDWAYYRCIELATRAFATPEGYSVAFQGAGDPNQSYSMLEFGVANGQSFQTLLHFRDVWLSRMRLKNKVLALGFDTFEGIPASREGDTGLPWREGDFSAVNLQRLQELLARKFRDFQLIQGKFAQTLDQNLTLLRDLPPIFISIDCDYYSSTMDVFQRLLPDIALHGSLFYFDDVSINFGAEMTGELKAIREVNAGAFGSHIALVEHPLWIETGEIRHYKQVYRLFNLKTAEKQAQSRPADQPLQLLDRKSRISPL